MLYCLEDKVCVCVCIMVIRNKGNSLIQNQKNPSHMASLFHSPAFILVTFYHISINSPQVHSLARGSNTVEAQPVCV